MRLRACLLVLAAAFSACDSDAPDDPLAVEGDLTASLPPTYDGPAADAPPPFVVVATTGAYPCGGYTLIAETQADARRLTVEVEGVRGPQAFGVCGTALAPATLRVDVPANLSDDYSILLVDPDGRTFPFVLALVNGRYEVVPAPAIH